MLADQDKKNIEQILKDELGELKLSIKELKKLLEPASPTNVIGRFSRIDALEMQSANMIKLQNQQHWVRQIGQALLTGK